MKKISLFLFICFCLISSFAFAEEESSGTEVTSYEELENALKDETVSNIFITNNIDFENSLSVYRDREVDITGKGEAESQIVLDGKSANPFFTISSSTTSLSNLTFQNGGGSSPAVNVNVSYEESQETPTFNIADVKFENNKNVSGSNGGALSIVNPYNSEITNSEFNKNSVLNANGGALYYDSTNIGNLKSIDNTFSGNNAYDGGAIYAESNIASTNDTFKKNTSDNNGGAIYAKELVLKSGIINNNSATNNGGAIYVSSMTASGNNISYNQAVNGGAIYITDNANIKGGNLSYNSSSENGGAIYSTGDINLGGQIIINNNSADGNGGAIYMDSGTTLTINALGEGIIFRDNNAVQGKDIYLNNATLSINNNSKVEIYGGIAGTSSSVVNVSSNSTFNLYGTESFAGNVNIDNSILGVFNDISLSNVSLTDSTLNMQNKVINTLATNLTANGENNIFVDVDLANNKIDTISNATGKFNLDDYNQLAILSDIDNESADLQIASGITLDIDTNAEFYGPVNVYKLNQTSDSSFKMTPTGEYNPSVFALPLANNSRILNNINISNSLYNRIDIIFSRDALTKNKEASFSLSPEKTNGNIIKNDAPTQAKNYMAWFIPLYAYQKVNYEEGIDDSKNYLYGGLAGIDYPFYEIGSSYLVPTIFFGYVGSRQDYKNTKLHNNSLAIGAMGTLKNDFALLSLQTYIQNGTHNYDFKKYNDNFDIFSFTTSLKGELDIDISENIVFQPAVTAMYDLVNSQDYTTYLGANMTSSRYHNIEILPSAKLMADFNGWYPYLSMSYAFNAMQNTEVKVNGKDLSKHKIKNFGEFSFGVENTFLEVYSGYAQISLYSGSVKGVGVQLGLRGYFD